MSLAAPAGLKYDQEKIRTDLMPVEPMLDIARVLTFGAKKYADRNWEKGIEWNRVYGALMRHLMAWWGGQDTDPETGLSHLAHAGCCVMFLLEFERTHPELDNRPKPATSDGVGKELLKRLDEHTRGQIPTIEGTLTGGCPGAAPQRRWADTGLRVNNAPDSYRF